MKMNSLFNTKTAIGINYETDVKQDRTFVIDIDRQGQTCTVYRSGLQPFSTCLPTDIPAFIAEMIGCPEAIVSSEFKDFADTVASAIHK